MEHAGDVIPQLAAAAPGQEFVAYFASLLPWFFKRMVSFEAETLLTKFCSTNRVVALWVCGSPL